MKKITILFLALSMSLFNYAQLKITGQLFQYESELPGVQVSFKDSEQKVESDFDGYFKLLMPIETQKNDLILNLNEMIIEIQNIEPSTTKLDLGRIELPTFKSIEIDEFDRLTKLEKDNCYPVYCWADLLGYTYTGKLEDEYLKLNCKQKITDFKYNPTTKTVTVNWDLIKECK